MSKVKLEQDGEDLILPLSDDLMKQVGWKVGDTVRWTDNKDGTWSLHKVEDQLDLFDEKDEAVLTLLKENQRLKDQVKDLESLIVEYKEQLNTDDWK